MTYKTIIFTSLSVVLASSFAFGANEVIRVDKEKAGGKKSFEVEKENKKGLGATERAAKDLNKLNNAVERAAGEKAVAKVDKEAEGINSNLVPLLKSYKGNAEKRARLSFLLKEISKNPLKVNLLMKVATTLKTAKSPAKSKVMGDYFEIIAKSGSTEVKPEVLTEKLESYDKDGVLEKFQLVTKETAELANGASSDKVALQKGAEQAFTKYGEPKTAKEDAKEFVQKEECGG